MMISKIISKRIVIHFIVIFMSGSEGFLCEECFQYLQKGRFESADICHS